MGFYFSKGLQTCNSLNELAANIITYNLLSCIRIRLNERLGILQIRTIYKFYNLVNKSQDTC